MAAPSTEAAAVAPAASLKGVEATLSLLIGFEISIEGVTGACVDDGLMRSAETTKGVLAASTELAVRTRVPVLCVQVATEPNLVASAH